MLVRGRTEPPIRGKPAHCSKGPLRQGGEKITKAGTPEGKSLDGAKEDGEKLTKKGGTSRRRSGRGERKKGDFKKL